MSKKCTPLWHEAHFEVKMHKTHQLRTTFGSWDVEKVHAVVARSTFPIQNVQSTPLSDHFLKLRCRKSARCCDAKHISKSKCTKHTMYGPLLEVQMSKKCTPLWREGHFEVKMLKTHKNTRVSDHFWRFRCRFASLHYITLHYTPLHCTELHYTTTLHNTTTTTTQLHSTTLNHTTLNQYPQKMTWGDWVPPFCRAKSDFWRPRPLQNEEPATNLARGLYKIRAPNPCFLVHVCDFQKHWPLQIGEPGMSKHLRRIATWKKEHHQKYKDPFCRGKMWKNLGLPVSPENPEMYKNPFCRGNFCSTFPDFVKSIQFVYIYAHECWQTTKPQTLQNEEPTVSAIYNMHQNAPTTKSGTCPCTPLQALRLSKKKWLDGPLQNEEPATNLARGFLYKIRDPTPVFWCTFVIFRNTGPYRLGNLAWANI